ncbi:hypothetical protein VTH06DRAFT_6248 [Thermothelomyces fergusii]
MADVIDMDPDIGYKGAEKQFNDLIVKPLSALNESATVPLSLVVVIDALDECVDQIEAKNFIAMLAAFQTRHLIRLRVLVSNMDDITRYLKHTLAAIARESGIPQTWIDEESIFKLSKKAEGLFIYAATIKKILGYIAVFFEPVSVSSLSVLVELDRSELDQKLRLLHSILDVPSDESHTISLLHLSFRDFLLSEVRSERLPFRVEESQMHRAVLERCLALMSEGLRQDICDFVLPGYLISDSTQDRVNACIPKPLQYACRYWVDHFGKLGSEERRELGLKDGGTVHRLLREKLLFWMEPCEDPDLSDLSRIRTLFGHLIPPWITKKPEQWDDTNALFSVLESGDGEVASVAFSPTDDLVAFRDKRGGLKIWNYITGACLYEFQDYYDGDGDGCADIVFSPSGRMIN